MSKIYTSADQLIGHTPLLELTHIEKEADLKATVLAKLEYFNPAGSVKDRIAKKIIRNINSHFPYPLSIVFYLSLISGGTQIGVVTPIEFKITLYVFICLGSFLFCAAH